MCLVDKTSKLRMYATVIHIYTAQLQGNGYTHFTYVNLTLASQAHTELLAESMRSLALG